MSNTWRMRLFFGMALRLAGFCQEWQAFPFRSSPLSLAGYAIIATCAWQLIKTLEQQAEEEAEQEEL